MKKTLLTLALVASMFAVSKAQDYAYSYDRLYASFVIGKAGDVEASDHGLQVGWASAVNITHKAKPLYFQFGIEFNWMTDSEKVEYVTARETILDLAVPLNLVIRAPLANDIFLEPMLGLNMRLNIVGQFSCGSLVDYFDSPYNARRFQPGMNAGMGMSVGTFYMGYRYNLDFTDYFDIEGVDSKTKRHFITIGHTF